jgi:hypothetical protein
MRDEPVNALWPLAQAAMRQSFRRGIAFGITLSVLVVFAWWAYGPWFRWVLRSP